MGKTAVLDAVATGALRDGVRVLRAAGVQFEADISYAGLNQLLVPLFDDFDVLDPVHRDALRVAVGIGGGPAPDRLLTSTAVLLLLRLISARTPLLLVIDDLPWLDRATNAVLGFVARRLVGSRIGFLAASRTGSDSFFESSGLTERRLEPLDDASSAELLALAHPDVSPAVRRRIAAEARGNPLALVELPMALSAEQRTTLAAVPGVLPLSERLQAMFASRVAGLWPVRSAGPSTSHGCGSSTANVCGGCVPRRRAGSSWPRHWRLSNAWAPSPGWHVPRRSCAPAASPHRQPSGREP
ncbi:AAA family ATPase [Streptomyces sp. NPDC059866]|uniref:AAA family ATPase n=1 Tax=Streptomyces sp. NPDC059866 TaxID=3346978 RepID=UPI003649BCA2